MPNSVFGNIFAIPQIDTRGIAAGVPKYNPMSGLAALIQAQNAVMRQARAAAGSAPLQPGQYKGVGDPSKGKWVKLPGVQDPVWIVGTSEKERDANEAKALNEARAAIIQSDTELQNQLNGLSEKSVPAQQEVLAAVRSNGTIARMAQKLEMSEADTAKLLLDTPTQELAKRQKAIGEAGLFKQLKDMGAGIVDRVSATVDAFGKSAEEQAAIGRRLTEQEAQRARENALADELQRLEKEDRSTAGYWFSRPFSMAAAHAGPIAATVVPQVALGAVGTAIGGPIGGLAGAVLGGGLSSAAYGAGEMLQRAVNDPNLTPAQQAQAAHEAYGTGALISGVIGAIPAGPSSVATTFGRRAAANAIRGLPEYAAATTKERAAMAAQEYARRRAEHGFARRIGSSYLAAASDAAALGIAEQAGHNLAYGAATGQDIPVTEGWAEQGLASAVLGLPFAAVMGRRARYLYPGGRYPTPEPGPVVSAEVLPQYGLPPAAPMLGGTPPPTSPQGGGSAGGAARATGGPQGARASSTPGSEQANATADATIAQMNEAIRRNPANMAALEQLDAEVSKQVSDVAATVQKAKSASTLEKQLTRQLEQQGVDPAVLERLALSYPDTSWRKQTLVKVLDKHQAALPPAEVVSLPPSVQDILGREAAELEAYRGNPPANATGRISESPADMATDGQLREGEAGTANLAANRTEPVYPEAAAPAAADQPLAEARVSDTATEGRGDAGTAAPDTGAPKAVAAAPRGQESGGTAQPDGERGGVTTTPERAAADTRKRGVESEAGAGQSSRSDGADVSWEKAVKTGISDSDWITHLKDDGTVNVKAWDKALRSSPRYADRLWLAKYEAKRRGEVSLRGKTNIENIKHRVAQGDDVGTLRTDYLVAKRLLKERGADKAIDTYFTEAAPRAALARGHTKIYLAAIRDAGLEQTVAPLIHNINNNPKGLYKDLKTTIVPAKPRPLEQTLQKSATYQDVLQVKKPFSEYRAEGRSYADWLKEQVKAEAHMDTPRALLIKKDGVWYSDWAGAEDFRKVHSNPDWETQGVPWYQSQEGVEAMQQQLNARKSDVDTAEERRIAEQNAREHPVTVDDMKAAIEYLPNKTKLMTKLYPKNMDTGARRYGLIPDKLFDKAAKVMLRKALGEPLNKEDSRRYKLLKDAGVPDMEINKQVIENTVEQAKEQGFRVSEEAAVTKNPTESAAKIIDNPNCVL